MRSLKKTAATLLQILVAVALLAGCSGDGDDTPGSVLDPPCMYFDGVTSPSASSVTAVQGAASGCDRLEVVLEIRGVTDIDRVEFTVVFNASRTTYDGYSLIGSVMGEDEGVDLDVTETTGTGTLSMTLDRIPGPPGVDAVDPETLVRLYFDRVTDAGFSTFSISNEIILGSEVPPQIKSGIVWNDGTIWLD